MMQWVLKQNGKIVTRQKMWRLTPDKLVRDLEVKKRAGFDAAIKFRYGDSFTFPKNMRGDPKEADDTHGIPFDEVAPNITEAEIVDDKGKPLQPTSSTDILMNYEVLLPLGEEFRLSKVIQRSFDSDVKVGGN